VLENKSQELRQNYQKQKLKQAAIRSMSANGQTCFGDIREQIQMEQMTQVLNNKPNANIIFNDGKL